jgi:glucose-6-phosphate 1-dehydrogenase
MARSARNPLKTAGHPIDKNHDPVRLLHSPCRVLHSGASMSNTGAFRVRSRVQEELCIERISDPCGVILFGASGDLTQRKLVPSLYHLFQRELLPKAFYMLGVGRTSMTDDAFRARLRESVRRFLRGGHIDDVAWARFSERLGYVTGDYGAIETYAAIAARARAMDKLHGTPGNLLFYLSTPPSVYTVVGENLAATGLSCGSDAPGAHFWRRVVVEKPFGSDLASARALNRALAAAFNEDQIYRIDHYLGKDTVQNILMLRFANAIFEPVWSRLYIDHVQILAAESIGIEHRGGYYDEAGCLRDIFQNHMMQLVAVTAMEPPATFDADRVRDERAKVIRSIRPLASDTVDRDVVRGQYGVGVDARGNPLPGYGDEPGVRPRSATETYVAMRLHVDNSRWRGVPFYLRAGKRLPTRATEIAVQFKPVPHSLFNPLRPEDLSPNLLVMRIQPGEGISLRFEAKHPGPKLCLSSVTMDFDYAQAYGIEMPEAYERLFLDAMLGDQTLFARQDEVELCWQLLGPILARWTEGPPPDFPNYASGTWGPEAARKLPVEEGRSWRSPE